MKPLFVSYCFLLIVFVLLVIWLLSSDYLVMSSGCLNEAALCFLLLSADCLCSSGLKPLFVSQCFLVMSSAVWLLSSGFLVMSSGDLVIVLLHSGYVFS
jgi:hypothetical protein